MWLEAIKLASSDIVIRRDYYPFIARALAEMGYDGPVGMEAFAKEDAEIALESFRIAFTL